MCAVWDVSSLDGGHFEKFFWPRLPPRFLMNFFKILADPKLGVTHSRRSAQLERLADAERARKLAVCLAVTKHKSSLRRVVRGLSLEHGLCPRR